jgi:hypothetical protein
MPCIPQPPRLESNSHRLENKDPKVEACNEKNVSMINNWCDGTNDGIRKTHFFGTINSEKMINLIFYLNDPPNDPSSFEYSPK